MYLPSPALKCALGGTDGPLRERVGSPPWSCTCPYGPAPVSGHEGWGNMDILKGPREKKFKNNFFFFAHFLLECVHVCLYESFLVSDLDVGMFILQCLHSYVPASDGRNLKRQPQEILPFLSDALHCYFCR